MQTNAFLVFAFCISLLGFASEILAQSSAPSSTKKVQAPPLTVREKALQENEVHVETRRRSKEFESSTEVDSRVQGILKLENPYTDPRERKIQVGLGLSFQSFKPGGQITVEGSRTFALKDNPEQIIPHFDFDLMSVRSRQTDTSSSNIFSFGAHSAAGYFGQTRRVSIPGGRESTDATFSSLFIELGPRLGYTHRTLGSWSFAFTPYVGLLQHTQNSSSSYARFSKSVNFWGYSLGPEFALVSNVSLFAHLKTYNAFQTNEDSDKIEVQPSSISIGFKTLW